MSKYPGNPHWNHEADEPWVLTSPAEWEDAEKSGHLTAEHVIQRLWRVLMHEFGVEEAAAYDSQGFFLSLTAEGIRKEGGVSLHVYPNDHQPPHAHVKIKGEPEVDVRVSLETGEVLSYSTAISAKRLRAFQEVVRQEHQRLSMWWQKNHGETVTVGDPLD